MESLEISGASGQNDENTQRGVSVNHKKIGKSELPVSEIVMGCWALGGGVTWGDQDELVSLKTIRKALDLGITTFDTAEIYNAGQSEIVLGKGLKGVREKAIIASKVWLDNMAKNKVVAACEGSLRRLQTDYIDLYQIHWANFDVPLEDTVGSLLELQEAGKIREIGVCNFGPQDLKSILQLCDITSNQAAYSLLFRGIEYEILPACVDRGIGVLAYSPLAQGLLTGMFHRPEDVDNERARTRFYSPKRPHTEHTESGCEEEAFAAIAEIRSIAKELNQPMSRIALSWVRQQVGVIGVLAGARTPEELEEDVQAVDLFLPPDIIGRLAAITGRVKRILGPSADLWSSNKRIR